MENRGKWYEKKWLIWALLIMVSPIGLLMLWAVGRYSIKTKSIITVVIVIMMTYSYMGNYFSEFKYTPGVQWKTESRSTKTQAKYEIGYLKKGSSWLDGRSKWNYNGEATKVEIWTGNKVVMGDGTELTQIYFLEGECAGVWGYTREIFLSRQEKAPE